MLWELLPPERIRIRAVAQDWRDVVGQVGAMFTATGAAQPRYTVAMQELIEKDGPYMVIAPGIALLHARPEEGVLEPAFALMTLARPVWFGHSTNDPVWLVIGLAARDADSHVAALAELGDLLSKEAALRKLEEAQTTAEAVAALQSVWSEPRNGEERGCQP